MPEPVLHEQEKIPALLDDLADWLTQEAQAAIRDHGHFFWALSGGSTPRQLYQLLASPSWQKKMPWDRTALFWGDERDVPPTHPDSNYRMVKESLLDHLNTPPWLMSRWYTESSWPFTLADQERDLQRWVPQSHGYPQFDVVLLGLGPEGHTASIFPDSPVLHSRRWIEHVFVPEHGVWRYTLGLRTINAARHCAFFVTGQAKADIVGDILKHPGGTLPASLVQPEHGHVHWFLDQGSATGVSR